MAGVKHHEDLAAWQLSEELRQVIVEFLAIPQIAARRRFCDQIDQSSSSAAANIAEGFGRYKPREFARFMRIALGSLGETQNHLRRGLNDRILSQPQFDRAWQLSVRAIKASKKLLAYLRSCDDRN
jgi:four helix bundle protein